MLGLFHIQIYRLIGCRYTEFFWWVRKLEIWTGIEFSIPSYPPNRWSKYTTPVLISTSCTSSILSKLILHSHEKNEFQNFSQVELYHPAEPRLKSREEIRKKLATFGGADFQDSSTSLKKGNRPYFNKSIFVCVDSCRHMRDVNPHQ